MRILFAGGDLLLQHSDRVDLLKMAYDLLQAYPAIKRNTDQNRFVQYLQDNPDKDRIVMLDSGAFSAWTIGEEVSIEAYVDFCKRYADIFPVFVNLDVIPASPGRIPTPEERKKAAEDGWANLLYMLDSGLPPDRVVHAYHYGEDIEWLEKLVSLYEEIQKNYLNITGYIGIGGMAKGVAPPQRLQFLERCMPYLTNSDGSARIRFHGFGMTSFELMARYPWYTVDSTSWMRNAIYGEILLPDPVSNSYLTSIQVSVTEGTSFGRTNHVDHYSAIQKKRIDAYLQTLGISLDECRVDTTCRFIANITFMKRAVDEINRAGNNWDTTQQRFL